MGRKYERIAGLTYGDLDRALLHLGYVRDDQPGEIRYHYPPRPAARLIYADFPADDEVRGIDLLTTRAVLEGFGVTDARDFDLLLLRSGTLLNTAASTDADSPVAQAA